MMLDVKKDKTIFVTGATGFVGAHLVRYLLSQGFTQILALKRANSAMDLVADVADKVTWVEGDLGDVPFLEDILRGVHQIYHCAAVVSFDPKDRRDLYTTNVTGTANIVNTALEAGVEKLVYMSSIAAIGRTKNNPHVSENNKWERSPLNTHYAISKFQAEQEVWRGVAEGLCAAVVNPSVILGPQFWSQGSGKLFEQVQEGLAFYTDGATGYVDVRDVVRFMVELMQSPIDNQRFILNGENRTYKAFFEKVADVLGKPHAHIRVTPLIRALAWRVEWLRSRFTGRRPLITKETARTSGTTFIFDNSRSLKVFPEFGYTPIDETIEQTGELYLQSLKSGRKSAYFTF